METVKLVKAKEHLKKISKGRENLLEQVEKSAGDLITYFEGCSEEQIKSVLHIFKENRGKNLILAKDSL